MKTNPTNRKPHITSPRAFGAVAVGLLAAVLVPALSSCAKCPGSTMAAAGPATSEQVISEVRVAVQKFAQAYESRQLADLAALYAHTDDLAVSAQGKLLHGWPAVEAHVQQFLRALTEVKLRLEDVTVSVVGRDGAIATTKAHRTYGDGVKTIDEYGTLTLVLRKQGDAWQIIGEHYSYAPVSE